MMRFRFTSVYEYLEHRFGRPTRHAGVVLFVGMIVLWMGFVVLVLSQVVEQLSGVPLFAVVVTVGIVATLYTMLGGLRAVIWTDVIQVTLLVLGAVATIGYVMWQTGSGLSDWLDAAARHLATSGEPAAIPVFSFDPTVRATVVSVAINMAVWQVCIHTSNQMTVQRYFSTPDVRAARRSFVTSSLAYVAITLLLVAVGLSVLYFYTAHGAGLDHSLDPRTQRDLIFPMFAMRHLPIGAAGALLAALLAAAMSTVDSGLNSIATVVALELRPADPSQRSRDEDPSNHVRTAKLLTLAAGSMITVAAYALTLLPADWGIIGAIPRTFNAITGPLGGLFLAGIFLPRVRQAAALVATACGLATSVLLGYLHPISSWLCQCNLLGQPWPDVSFAWILPCSFLATLSCAVLVSWIDRGATRNLAGLTWSTRHEPTSFTRTVDSE